MKENFFKQKQNYKENLEFLEKIKEEIISLNLFNKEFLNNKKSPLNVAIFVLDF